MKVAFTPAYGPADVLELRDVPVPTPGDDEVLIEVHAADVTAGDLRLRAADFPGFTALPGRLLMGLLRPRNAVQGTMFAGRVVAVGSAVDRYEVGDDVFGSADHSAYAEYLTVSQDGPMALLPANVGHDEAAAVPYGAGTALHFLRDLAKVQPGEHVLVLGASGGVGRYAVQLAKHLGAEVTAVCSGRNAALVRDLGADHVVDYTTTDFTRNGQRYDVIFDIGDATTFGRCRSSLTASGRYLTLFASVNVLWAMARTALTGGPRALFSVAMGDRALTETLRDLLERGVIRPVVAERFPLARIVDAHAEAERHHAQGSIVVTIAAPAPLQAVG